ncbi:hypothetical protein ACFGVR_05680 [Mucilaginibacter sp. AW1-3]
MAFANGTPVSINGTEYKAIQDFLVGDKVYAADYNSATQWSQQTIQFSNGTSGGLQPLMIYIRYMQQGNPGEIIVTPDQPFLLDTKQLIQADKLTPGDKLVSVTGQPVDILQIVLGQFTGGVHDISITIGSKDPGHWIAAAGLVCGDFAMQINQQSHNITAIGTPERQIPRKPTKADAPPPQPPKRAPRPRKK